MIDGGARAGDVGGLAIAFRLQCEPYAIFVAAVSHGNNPGLKDFFEPVSSLRLEYFGRLGLKGFSFFKVEFGAF